jgi:hypothetical protein
MDQYGWELGSLVVCQSYCTNICVVVELWTVGIWKKGAKGELNKTARYAP